MALCKLKSTNQPVYQSTKTLFLTRTRYDERARSDDQESHPEISSIFFLTFAEVKQGHGHMQSCAQVHKLPRMYLLYMPRKQINLG